MMWGTDLGRQWGKARRAIFPPQDKETVPRCFFQTWEEEGLGSSGARGRVWVRPACGGICGSQGVLHTPSNPIPTPPHPSLSCPAWLAHCLRVHHLGIHLRQGFEASGLKRGLSNPRRK